MWQTDYVQGGDGTWNVLERSYTPLQNDQCVTLVILMDVLGVDKELCRKDNKADTHKQRNRVSCVQ